jgi:DNA-binding HxlR family transcriptional regulator
MSTDFEKLRLFSLSMSKNYAPDILRVLFTYQDVSASEAASRLGLHINTVQEFLEVMHKSGIVSKEEVYEKKRPYFRYKLTSVKLKLEVDLSELFHGDAAAESKDLKIREKANSLATFNRSRNNLYFGSVMILMGEGRDRKEKRINLTTPQGVFLYNLPFPDGQFQTVSEIMQKAGIDAKSLPEITDIVNLLIQYRVIEKS